MDITLILDYIVQLLISVVITLIGFGVFKSKIKPEYLRWFKIIGIVMIIVTLLMMLI